jgi:hypothetical protein
MSARLQSVEGSEARRAGAARGGSMTISRFALPGARALPFALVLAGCGGGTWEDPSLAAAGSDQQAQVSEATFDQAYSIVSRIDYVPFEYKIDGCYARALYMSLELAARGIETNSLFAFATVDEAPLVVGDIEWGYHVAPLLFVPTDDGSVLGHILDPAISDSPLTVDDWVGAMGHTVAPQFVEDAHGREIDVSPELLYVPGSRYAPMGAQQEDVFQNVDIPSFDALPAFRSSDVVDACTVLFQYLELDPSISNTAAAQSRLVARTKALVASMVERDKFEASPEAPSSWAATYPVERRCLSAVRAGRAALH